MTEITEITSQEQFEDLKAAGPVVVDYWADWCGPCKKFSPHYHSAADKSTGNVVFASVDVEANAWASKSENIMQIPTVRLYADDIALDLKGRTVLPLLNEINEALGG